MYVLRSIYELERRPFLGRQPIGRYRTDHCRRIYGKFPSIQS